MEGSIYSFIIFCNPLFPIWVCSVNTLAAGLVPFNLLHYRGGKLWVVIVLNVFFDGWITSSNLGRKLLLMPVLFFLFDHEYLTPFGWGTNIAWERRSPFPTSVCRRQTQALDIVKAPQLFRSNLLTTWANTCGLRPTIVMQFRCRYL